MELDRPAERADGADPDGASRRGAVLVVETSEAVGWTLREGFGARGVLAVQAKSLWAAQWFLKQYPVRLVISGVQLIDGPGINLLRLAKEHRAPLFLMSGHPYDPEQLRSAGAAGFFSKPFSVMAAVDQMLVATPGGHGPVAPATKLSRPTGRALWLVR